MGREVRMVPPDWKHPKRGGGSRVGQYIPLLENNNNDFEDAVKEWEFQEREYPESELRAHWSEGFIRGWYSEHYKTDGEPKWKPVDAKYAGTSFEDYYGLDGVYTPEPKPNPKHYMPAFAPGTATHLCMYECTSEGTPISPAFATPEELARWLTDNKASAFADMTCTYEQWLAACKAGWAPSAVDLGNGLQPGAVLHTEKPRG